MGTLPCVSHREGFFCAGCAPSERPVQMYEGMSHPKEQVGIVRSACKTGPDWEIRWQERAR